MNTPRQLIEDRLSQFGAWLAGRSFSSARLVQYCGEECIGGIDIPIDQAEEQIRGCLDEGFRADWEETCGQLYICISEDLHSPLDWGKVVREEHFSDIDAVLRRAGFTPKQR